MTFNAVSEFLEKKAVFFRKCILYIEVLQVQLR